MFLNILVLVVFIVSIALLLRIIWHRLPELKVLDIASIPNEKKTGAKARILESKLKRQSQEASERIGVAISPLKEKFSGLTQKIKDNVATLERKYKKNGEIEEVRSKSINELFAEAEKYLSDEEYALAEKSLIEVIARDSKNVRAYELLGQVYRLQKNYSQAEEVIKYLIKLESLKYRKKDQDQQLKRERMEDAEDAIMEAVEVDSRLSRFYDDLGKIYEADGKKDKALDCYLKANAIEPNSPKFLDKVTELAIAAGDRGLAKKTYKRLKEINPENAKLEDFLEALEKIK